MAGEEYLGLLGGNDLAAFNQSVTQSDPYGLAGRSLGAWQPDTSTWDPTTTGVTSFAKSFLSGLLGNYAKQNAADQLNSVIGVLPQLKSDPMSVVAPEGVNADAFAALKGSAVLRNYQAKAQQEQTLADLMQKVGIAGLTKKAEIIGENDAYGALEKLGGAQNPNSPGYKLLQNDKENKLNIDSKITNARDYLRIAGAPYVTARENLDLLTKNFKQSNPASDLVYAIAANKILDPSAIVRPDDVANIQAITPLLEKNIAGFRNYITPAGTISPTGKAIIMKTIAPKLEALGNNYKGLLDTETNRIKTLGGDPTLLAAVPFQPFDLSSFGSGSMMDARAFAQQAKEKGLSVDQARSEWAKLQAGQ